MVRNQLNKWDWEIRRRLRNKHRMKRNLPPLKTAADILLEQERKQQSMISEKKPKEEVSNELQRVPITNYELVKFIEANWEVRIKDLLLKFELTVNQVRYRLSKLVTDGILERFHKTGEGWFWKLTEDGLDWLAVIEGEMPSNQIITDSSEVFNNL